MTLILTGGSLCRGLHCSLINYVSWVWILHQPALFFMRTCRSNWFGVGASSYTVEWRKMCFSYLRCVEQLKVQKWGQKQSDRCGKTCFKDRLGELMKKQPERVKDSNLSLNAEETRDQTTKCDKVSLLGYAIWIWKCACESRKESERKDRKKKRKRG